MKNIFKACITAALGLTLLTGCIKVIDPQTNLVTTDQAAEAPGSFDKFVTAITNSLCGSYTYGGTSNLYPYDFGYPAFFLMRDYMGNDLTMEDASSSWYTQWYSCGTGLGPAYAVCQMPWTYYYGWIKSCNVVLSLAGEEPSDNQAYGAGIAYAMRAMFYMDLARMFAQQTYIQDPEAETVPLVLEDTSTEDLTNNPRATNEEIWDLILSDLDKAETYLANYTRSDKYTPDLSVVYGLKARAYLTMGEWANAESYAKQAQDGYSVLTETQYLDRSTGFNTPNSSWMFAVTFKETDDNIILNDGDGSWGTWMIIEVGASGMGYAANYGSPVRIDRHLYETIPSTDFRKKCFLDFAIDDMTNYDDIYAAVSEYSDVPESIITTAWGTNSEAIGGLEVKFRPKGGEHVNQYDAWTVAVPLMRVEEMYLIEAEAAGRQDESRGINLLTSFAQTRDPNYTYGTHTEAYGNTASGTFINEVWWQRRVELWGEGFATFDNKRLDKGIIRSYANTNHPEGYRWNYGDYGVNGGNIHPNWMDLCIVQTETNYNTACTNNPTPSAPTDDSAEYVW